MKPYSEIARALLLSEWSVLSPADEHVEECPVCHGERPRSLVVTLGGMPRVPPVLMHTTRDGRIGIDITESFKGGATISIGSAEGAPRPNPHKPGCDMDAALVAMALPTEAARDRARAEIDAAAHAKPSPPWGDCLTCGHEFVLHVMGHGPCQGGETETSCLCPIYKLPLRCVDCGAAPTEAQQRDIDGAPFGAHAWLCAACGPRGWHMAALDVGTLEQLRCAPTLDEGARVDLLPIPTDPASEGRVAAQGWGPITRRDAP